MSTPAPDSARSARVSTGDNWYVTNGEDLIGPVGIALLLRGIVHGKIPDGCHVRQEAWSTWRTLDQVREIAEVRRDPEAATREPGPAPSALAYAEAARLLFDASDPGEGALIAMDCATRASHASVALFHRRRTPHDILITSCVYGEGAEMLLGRVIPRDDPVFFVARLGVRILRNEGGGHTQLRVLERLRQVDPKVSSVAMFPLIVDEVLVGMLEMGRTDHAFRRSDLESVQAVVDALRDWLARRG
jgi:hypothetical protein